MLIHALSRDVPRMRGYASKLHARGRKCPSHEPSRETLSTRVRIDIHEVDRNFVITSACANKTADALFGDDYDALVEASSEPDFIHSSDGIASEALIKGKPAFGGEALREWDQCIKFASASEADATWMWDGSAQFELDPEIDESAASPDRVRERRRLCALKE